jgi:conserved NLP/P60 family protein
MHWISLLLLGLTAGLFLYIMVLETFLTDSRLTARTFNMSIDELRKPALNTAMKNLGVYNGLVGAGLLYALLFSPDGREVAAVFFAFGLVVTIYGAISSQFSILFKQGTLPLLGLVSLVLL